MKLQESLWLLVTLLCVSCIQATILPQIPSLTNFKEAKHAAGFQLSSKTEIVVDAKFANLKANKHSPSLLDYAHTFSSDLSEIAGLKSIRVRTDSSKNQRKFGNAIYLTVLSQTSAKKYKYYNGNATDEAYELDINQDIIKISGSSALGTFWGTRSVLQQVAIHQNQHSSHISIPAGSGADVPGWEVRGFMLDAGRHWFDVEFLSDLCVYASFWKINEFHVHAVDNLWNPAYLEWQKLYAGFRFQAEPGSPLEGLSRPKNETWSRREFEWLQSKCLSYGVTVIPEIESPGHALAITQWKPELMIKGTPDNMNITQPEMIPTIKSIWKEFLPWFYGSEVSIGADEYEASLANDYIDFVNTMADYIHQQSGKSIRVWGTNEPSKTKKISTKVTIQHWDFPGDDIPVNLMKQGYNVINSEQSFLYLDGKSSGETSFPQELNQDIMWTGAPGGNGWAPNIFDAKDSSNNTAVDEPRLRGSIMPLWSDWGNNATTKLEVYYSFARSLATLGLKTWSGSGSSALTRSEFNSLYPLLNQVAPGQNLNRVVPSKGKVVVSYDFKKTKHGHVTDKSGNHYEASANNVKFGDSGATFEGSPKSYITTPIGSMGPPYTLSFTVNPTSLSGILFSGTDSVLLVNDLTWNVTGQLYSLNYTMPLNKATKVEIHATREVTYAYIGQEKTPRYWYTVLDIWGDYMQTANMSFAAPIQKIGAGFKGTISNVQLSQGA
ncbi:hypothetical protein INT44_007931 [Umbelopsis vinacea]|uniref:beta-N-acetylhexosaminidase n=1 Tax=Umbelopsis vinacea TaxID=44442 RepID=A0A8H7PPG1_9FUNG|nr:hypothetical protein INT44_007931 [Umbelopsis vinacea]